MKVEARGKPTDNIWKEDVLCSVDPRHTALLVVDIQNDFCSDDGTIASWGGDVSSCSEAADRITKFLPKVRGLLNFVAFFNLVYDPDRLSESQRERLMRSGPRHRSAGGQQLGSLCRLSFAKRDGLWSL